MVTGPSHLVTDPSNDSYWSIPSSYRQLLVFVAIVTGVATTIEITTTIEINISIVVKNAFQNKSWSQPLFKYHTLLIVGVISIVDAMCKHYWKKTTIEIIIM